MDRAPQNEPMSALTHLLGALLSIAGIVLLVVSAALNGTAVHVVTYSIFGGAMLVLYVMSAVYHSLCASGNERAKQVFRTLDHVSIYLLIAGTYTPVALIALPPAWGWTVFGLIWSLALVGIFIKSLSFEIPAWASLMLYLAMGWLILIALSPLREALSPYAWRWLVLGGTAYTAGAVFFALDRIVPRTRWFGMHEIFHVFVMFGSFAHFWMLFRHLVHVG